MERRLHIDARVRSDGVLVGTLEESGQHDVNPIGQYFGSLHQPHHYSEAAAANAVRETFMHTLGAIHFQVTEYRFASRGPFSVFGEFEAPQWAALADDTARSRFDLVQPPPPGWGASGTPELRMEVSLELSVAADQRLEGAPADRRLESEFGVFQRKVQVTPSHLAIADLLQILSHSIGAREQPLLREFLQEVWNASPWQFRISLPLEGEATVESGRGSDTPFAEQPREEQPPAEFPTRENPSGEQRAVQQRTAYQPSSSGDQSWFTEFLPVIWLLVGAGIGGVMMRLVLGTGSADMIFVFVAVGILAFSAVNFAKGLLAVPVFFLKMLTGKGERGAALLATVALLVAGVTLGTAGGAVFGWFKGASILTSAVAAGAWSFVYLLIFRILAGDDFMEFE